MKTKLNVSYYSFDDALKFGRICTGMPLREAAERLGISQLQYRAMEEGRICEVPDERLLHLMGYIFETDLDAFVKLAEDFIRAKHRRSAKKIKHRFQRI